MSAGTQVAILWCGQAIISASLGLLVGAQTWDYSDTESFDLEMNRDHSVIFEIAPKIAFQTLLLTMMATPLLLRDSCPQ